MNPIAKEEREPMSNTSLVMILFIMCAILIPSGVFLSISLIPVPERKPVRETLYVDESFRMSGSILIYDGMVNDSVFSVTWAGWKSEPSITVDTLKMGKRAIIVREVTPEYLDFEILSLHLPLCRIIH